MYSSTDSQLWHLMEVSGQHFSLPLYCWGRTLVPIQQESGWATQPICTFGEQETVLHLPGFEYQTIQPVAQSDLPIATFKFGTLLDKLSLIFGLPTYVHCVVEYLPLFCHKMYVSTLHQVDVKLYGQVFKKEHKLSPIIAVAL